MEEDIESDVIYTPQEVLENFIDSDDTDILCQCVTCVTESLDTCDEEFLDKTVVPSLIKLLKCEDKQPKTQMIDELCNFSEALFDVFPEKANDILNQQIFPILSEIISQGDAELIEGISYAYAALLTLIEKNDFVEKQLPLLVSFSKSASKEVRMTCVAVVSFLTQFFDPKVWYPQLYEILSTLASDQLGTIRAKIPQLIALYAKKIPDQISRAQLSGRYILFCRDSTTTVRQAAAEFLMTLSDALDQNERYITILPEINMLLIDPVESVRSAASRNLGQIIASLGSRADTQIVSKYCSLLTSRDANASFQAAYAFSAVAIALGKERWGELASAFEVACASKFPKVRRTLSFALSSFAHLLEPNDLVNVAGTFLRDFPEIAVGVISTLHQIVNLIEDKQSLLFCLEEPDTKYKSWRMRIKVSEQLRYCAEFYDKNILFQSAKDLIADDVAVVRKDAVLSFSYLLTEDKLSLVTQMTCDDRYWEREAAASVIGSLDINLAKQLIKPLLDLCHDKVANVRISAAVAAISLSDRLDGEDKEAIVNAIEELKHDADIDVAKTANNIAQ